MATNGTQSKPAATPAPAPPMAESEQAEVHKILVEQGLIEETPPEGDAGSEPAADDVFDTPEEAAAAAELAAEAGETGDLVEETPEETEETPEETAEPEEDRAAVSRGLQALTQREARLVEREQAVAQREREQGRLLQLAVDDPVAFYKALKVDKTADLAVALWYAEHGDAPPQVREKLNQNKTAREVQQLKEQIAARDAQAAQQAQVATAINYIHGRTAELPDDVPELQAEVEEDRQAVTRALYQRVLQLGAQGEVAQGESDEEVFLKAARSLNKDIRAAVQRAKRVDAKLAERAAKKITPPPKVAPKGVVTPKTPAPVAGEKKTVGSKNLSSKATAHTRPRREPETHEEVIQATISKIKAGNIGA